MTVDDLQSFKREVILALFADNTLMQQLVLKGGNLLDVVYGISTRPSRDIDLSICGDVEDLDRFRQTIEKALAKWFGPKGYVVFDVNLREEPPRVTEEFRDFWGGYKVDFKIIDAQTYREFAEDRAKLRVRAMTVVDDDGKKFPIEISKHEYVDEKVAEIVDDLTVYAYSPEMLVAEKLRAICQQMPEYTFYLKKHDSPRGRDFLDIYTVAEYFRIDFGDRGFRQTLTRVFQAKRVSLALLAKIVDEATREYHRPDFVSIAPTIRPGLDLQEFDFYYDYVVEKCSTILESLGDV
jgi:predicted nucleotidyltransferase component of viral defense system